MDRDGELDDDDIARLADRLAVLRPKEATGDGRGRTVAAMARRLGLTGGRSMEVFMTGAAATLAVGLGTRRTPGDAADLDRLRREVEGLLRTQQQLDRAFRQAQAEARQWRAEADRLREALERTRGRGRLRAWVAAVVLLALVGGALFLTVGPGMRLLPAGVLSRLSRTTPTQGRAAAVLTPHAPLRPAPDTATAPLANLPAETSVVVLRVFWNNLMQWAEVGVGERRGFMLVSDLRMS